MMLSLKELLKNTEFKDVPKNIQDNLLDLLEKVNKVRIEYNKPMTVTSGLRSMVDHLRIYKAKGITDKKKIPMQSKHLSGQAVDISDPKQELQNWCLVNKNKLEEFGLWCEDFKYTKNWVHFQTLPPKSGNRFFIP